MSEGVIAPCSHLEGLTVLPEPPSRECAECVALGDVWVHLRMCMACHKVGCCDSSKNKHASAHARAAGHPVMRGIEPGERWLWCFVDAAAIEL